jgi:hypothetical protein
MNESAGPVAGVMKETAGLVAGVIRGSMTLKAN